MSLLLRCGNLRPNISLGVRHALQEGFNVACMAHQPSILLHGPKKQFHIIGAIFCPLLRKTYVHICVSYNPPLAYSCSVRLSVASQGYARRSAQNVRGRQDAVAAVVGNLTDERAKTEKGPDNSSKVWNKLCIDLLALDEEANVSI